LRSNKQGRRQVFRAGGPGRVVVDLPMLPSPPPLPPFYISKKARICANLMGCPVRDPAGGGSGPLDLSARRRPW